MVEPKRVADLMQRHGLEADLAAVGRVIGEGPELAVGTEPDVTTVRGRGLLIGADLTTDNAAAVVDAGRAAGFLINNTGPATIRFAPPLVLTDDDVTRFGEAWPGILRAAQS